MITDSILVDLYPPFWRHLHAWDVCHIFTPEHTMDKLLLLKLSLWGGLLSFSKLEGELSNSANLLESHDKRGIKDWVHSYWGYIMAKFKSTLWQEACSNFLNVKWGGCRNDRNLVLDGRAGSCQIKKKSFKHVIAPLNTRPTFFVQFHRDNYQPLVPSINCIYSF